MGKKQTSSLQVIETCYNTIEHMSKNVKLWADDNSIIQLYDIMANALHNEIHLNLMSFKSEKNEEEIRRLIRRYVIGYQEKGKNWLGAVATLENKIIMLTKKKDKPTDLIAQYLDLRDDFMALASFRSFKHFCLYMEQDWDKKVWKPQIENFEGWFYYANQMVLDKKVQFIEKQMATGRGKSLSDCFLISWIFGQDINSDVIKVFGNKYNCVRAFDTITTLMADRKFAKVFPYYQQFNCKVDSIFEIKKQKDGEFKLAGSQKPTNFLTVGKESKISGTRAMYMFLDDITQAEDSASIRMHDKDIATYLEVWDRRKHSNKNFFLVVGGTTYNVYDILSWIKARFGGDVAVEDKRFKWTTVARSNRIIANGLSVFICIPALDPITDLSTYEEEYPTEQLRKMREDNYETFMAMEQQQPQRPKNSPFYYTQLQEYADLPAIGTHNRTDSHWAYLDGKRSGKDFCAMPIFSFFGEKHYLIDVLYDNRPMKEQYSFIVAKIRQHHITKLYIENNINEGLKKLLDSMLNELGVYFCKIEEIYNTTKKDIRISNSEADIKSLMVFPKFGMYSRSNPVGKALEELYSYSYVKKNEHDDFTDTLSGYSECFIGKKRLGGAKLSIFKR